MSGSVSARNELIKTLRVMLNTVPFSDISVCALCRACQINRKSFYYHFKDKYDMVCQIFESEFLEDAKTREYGSPEAFLYDMCEYLNQNRAFYAKILRVEGQNSFREYFGKMVVDCIKLAYSDRDLSPEDLDFLSHFLAGAFFTAIFEWMTATAPIPPREFTERIRRCMDSLHPSF